MSDQLSTFQACAFDLGDNGTAEEAMLRCVSDTLEATQNRGIENLTSWMFILFGSLIFFMQAGFAMLCAGCVRKKNVQNTMLKNLLDACGAALGFYIVGFGLAFGSENEDITFVGTNNFLNLQDVDPAFWFFEYTFSATCVTIVAGTLAERCQMIAYLSYSFVLTAFVYPVVVHSIWSNNGFLSAFVVEELRFQGIGVIDFAGSGVVHITGGTTALVATYVLGARKGRFYDSRGRELERPRPFPGHSMALQILGTLILWFGWYGFNPGSALLLTATSDTGRVAALAAANTSLSAAAGAVSALSTNLYFEERRTGEYSFNITMAMNGCLGGLVAITAGCGTMESWAACITGIIAGWVYMAGSSVLIRFKLDDAVDAIPVHMFCGAWGMLATGLFSSPRLTQLSFGQSDHVGFFYSLGRGQLDAVLLGNQCLAILFIFGWTMCLMTPFFFWLNYMGWFRADSLEELVGLDQAYHGGKDGGDDGVVEDAVARLDTSENGMPMSLNARIGPSAVEGTDDASWTDLTASAPRETAKPQTSASRRGKMLDVSGHDDSDSEESNRL